MLDSATAEVGLIGRARSLPWSTVERTSSPTAYGDWLSNGRDGRRVSGKTIRYVHELLRNTLNSGFVAIF